MTARVLTIAKWTVILAAAVLLTILGVRAYDSQRGSPLERWHTFVPDELSAGQMATATWADYLQAEQKLFDQVRANVTAKLEAAAKQPANRYFEGSPLYPGHFAVDWNRSYTLEPEGAQRGAVVLLHGLTDSPYSLRHVARLYSSHGFVAVGIRLPGHGTVPSGLTRAGRDDWLQATRLAVREARRRAGPSAPLHIVGFSNGGALAMKYALDAAQDKTLPQVDRLVLISPMIGITSLARFAGIFGWPAVFPAFAKAAWLGIVPEFNPFKYNSFPVNGARQSSLVARSLQADISRLQRAGRLGELPPILTFQSAVDFTVSSRAIVDALYARLPQNRHELVLFDLNRNTKFGPLVNSNTDTVISQLLPAAPRGFRTTVIANADAASASVVERVIEPGTTAEKVRPLELTYPRDVFSLSHVALPFPMNDPLYGVEPDTAESFGVNLGAMAIARGEREVLTINLDALVRMSSNPFYPYMMGRIEEGIPVDNSARRVSGAGTR